MGLVFSLLGSVAFYALLLVRPVIRVSTWIVGLAAKVTLVLLVLDQIAIENPTYELSVAVEKGLPWAAALAACFFIRLYYDVVMGYLAPRHLAYGNV